MKTKQKLALIAFLIAITSGFAQYNGNGYGNGYGNGRNGYDRGMGQMNQGQPDKPKEIPNEVIAANFMKDMKPALNLDELQEIAITNILIENLNKEGRIRKQGLPQDQLVEEYKLLSESTDKQINQILNKEQREKYLVFKDEKLTQKKSKKDKSKDKSKDKKEKEE